jgi:hypothetical protein
MKCELISEKRRKTEDAWDIGCIREEWFWWKVSAF